TGSRSPSWTRALGSRPTRSRRSSRASTAPGTEVAPARRVGWGWGSRSAAASWRPMAAASGPRTAGPDRGRHPGSRSRSAPLRRASVPAPTPAGPFLSEDVAVDFVQRRVVVRGQAVKLTPKEYGLLQELVVNAGKVLTHQHLLGRVWGPEYLAEHTYLRVF